MLIFEQNFDERIDCFLLVITLTISFNQSDYGYIEKFSWFRTICIDDPEDDFDPDVEPEVCAPGQFYNRSKGYVLF